MKLINIIMCVTLLCLCLLSATEGRVVKRDIGGEMFLKEPTIQLILQSASKDSFLEDATKTIAENLETSEKILNVEKRKVFDGGNAQKLSSAAGGVILKSLPKKVHHMDVGVCPTSFSTEKDIKRAPLYRDPTTYVTLFGALKVKDAKCRFEHPILGKGKKKCLLAGYPHAALVLVTQDKLEDYNLSKCYKPRGQTNIFCPDYVIVPGRCVLEK